ncbi:oxidoreductase C-terminal domain-containing protein [Bradyrhizobium sp. RDT10]
MRIENWANAQDQAVATAKSMLGKGEGYDAVPWFWSDQYKDNLQVVGSFADAEEVVRGDVAGGRFSAIALRGEEVVGAAAVNSKKDMASFRRIVEKRRSMSRTSLADPKFDLRRAI